VVQKVQEQAAQLAQAAERERSMNRQQLLTATIEKIRTSLELDIVFSSTTAAVRELLNVERVAIYRFNQDWSGKFVADSIIDNGSDLRVPPLSSLIKLSQADETGEYPRNETFVPIPQGEKLWGLLVAYQNSQPRYWQNEDVNLLAQVGVQLGVAIQQAELLSQTKQQALKLSQTVAELQQTQTRLIQGEKMASLGQLVAGIAHEINNPVNFIHGNLIHVEQYTQNLLKTVELYQTLYPDSNEVVDTAYEALDLAFVVEDLPKTIASMQMGTDRIRDIVLSLRNFSRMDEADFKNVDLHQGLDSTLLILAHRLKANGPQRAIVIDKHYADLKLVKCYPAQLNQVFMNIIANSIDALEEMTEIDHDFMPKITLTTQRLGSDQITITIADNGRGIPDEVRSRIFDPFFTTKEPGKGTGLGLPICYQIIHERHGGTIECQSILGSGSTFIITIPTIAAPVQQIQSDRIL
jgi:signal transduction histidine kinase